MFKRCILILLATLAVGLCRYPALAQSNDQPSRNDQLLLLVRSDDLTQFIDKLDEFKLSIETRFNGNIGPGYSFLEKAIKSNSNSIAEWLIEEGANVNSRDIPLSLAAEAANDAIIPLLLEFGADIERKDSYGRTALLIAVKSYCEKSDEALTYYDFKNRFERTVRLLLNEGPDVDVKSNKDETALTIAAKRGNAKIVKWLLEAGANVDLIGLEGKTAFELAEFLNHREVLDVLAAEDPSLANFSKAPEKLSIGDQILELEAREADTGYRINALDQLPGKLKIIAFAKLESADSHSPFIQTIQKISANFPEVDSAIIYICNQDYDGQYSHMLSTLSKGGKPVTKGIQLKTNEYLALDKFKAPATKRFTIHPEDLDSFCFATLAKNHTVLIMDGSFKTIALLREEWTDLDAVILKELNKIDKNYTKRVDINDRLVKACLEGKTDAATALLNKGADPNYIGTEFISYNFNRVDISPDEQLVKIYHSTDKKQIATPLIAAALSGNNEIVNNLLKRKLDPAFPVYLSQASRALEIALDTGNGPIAINLLKYAEGYNLEEALHQATRKKMYEVIDYLLGLGADVDKSRALMAAVSVLDKSLVKKYLALGADPSLGTKPGETVSGFLEQRLNQFSDDKQPLSKKEKKIKEALLEIYQLL